MVPSQNVDVELCLLVVTGADLAIQSAPGLEKDGNNVSLEGDVTPLPLRVVFEWRHRCHTFEM
jgi:hypothetical protein